MGFYHYWLFTCWTTNFRNGLMDWWLESLAFIIRPVYTQSISLAGSKLFCYVFAMVTLGLTIHITSLFQPFSASRTCGESYDNSQCAHGDRVSLNIFGIRSDTWSCSCTGNLCNSGSQLAVSSALIMAALAKYLL